MRPPFLSRRPRRNRTHASLALGLAAALVLSGCGGGGGDDEKSPSEVMATAKKNLDETSSVHLVLSTKATPASGNGVLGATGDLTSEPAFEGEVKVVLSGLTATVPVTSVGGKVYAKLPLQTTFRPIDPAEYGAPDPADFADPENGLSGLLTKLKDLEEAGESRQGETILTTYSGTLDGAAVKKIIPSAAADKTYKTRVGVDDKGFAITVRVTGAFFADSEDVTYDVTFDSYGKAVTIKPPPT